MPASRLESLKIKAKLLQKAKKRSGKTIQLKTALEIIAKASGFSSWRALKRKIEVSELFSSPQRSAFWNVWYASYDEARQHLEDHGGYLIPHEKHFFICDIHYIESLGIKRTDPDLEKVGANWANPKNPTAWTRIVKKIKEHAV